MLGGTLQQGTMQKMNRQKLLQQILGVISATMMLIGCSTPTAKPIPFGKVEPVPDGCLYMEFFSPSDEAAYQRDQSGHINAVITQTDRIEPLLKQWSQKEFKEAVYDADKSKLDKLHIPGTVAWEYLERYLQSEDKIWTFGVLDLGFVIIRDNQVFCIVVTNHQW